MLKQMTALYDMGTALVNNIFFLGEIGFEFFS